MICKLCGEIFDDEGDMGMHLMYYHALITDDWDFEMPIEMPKFNYLSR